MPFFILSKQWEKFHLVHRFVPSIQLISCFDKTVFDPWNPVEDTQLSSWISFLQCTLSPLITEKPSGTWFGITCNYLISLHFLLARTSSRIVAPTNHMHIVSVINLKIHLILNINKQMLEKNIIIIKSVNLIFVYLKKCPSYLIVYLFYCILWYFWSSLLSKLEFHGTKT